MFEQSIALFKARKDPVLASRIAGDMAVDGAVEYASWPLAIAKFWMSLALIVLTLLSILFLWLGTLSHWIIAIPIFPLGGLMYGIIRTWRGMNAGKERVAALAKMQVSNQINRFDTPTV